MPTGPTTGFGLLKRFSAADCTGPVIAESLVSFGLCDQQPLSYSPTTKAFAVQYLVQNVVSISAGTVTLTSQNFTDTNCFTPASTPPRTYTTSLRIGQCLSNPSLGLYQRYDYIGATPAVHTSTAVGLLSLEYPHAAACQAKVASRSVLYTQGICAIWQPGVYYVISKSCYDNAVGTADFTMTFYSDASCAVASALPPIVSYAALATGSVPPCFRYSSNPNARTQTFTCRRDPTMFNDGGTTIYTTYHKGAQCSSKAHLYAVENTVLNTCQTSDVRNPLRANKLTWTQSPVPHQFVCKEGALKYSITKTSYPVADATCSQAGIVSIEEHDYLCRRDAATGMYKMTHCGGNLPTYYSSKDQLVVKVYSRPQCDSASSSLGYLFNQCTPMYDPQSKRLQSTFQRLKFENSYVTDWRKAGAANTVVVVRQSVFADGKCATPPVSSALIEFTSSMGCKPNELHPQLFYTFAQRVSGGGGLSGISWLQAD